MSGYPRCGLSLFFSATTFVATKTLTLVLALLFAAGTIAAQHDPAEPPAGRPDAETPAASN